MKISLYIATRLFRKMILFLVRVYCRFVPGDDISIAVQMVERGSEKELDCTAVLNRLGARKLFFLDVGAAGGMDPLMAKYSNFVTPILVEPDPAEYARLKAAGHKVIGSALAEHSGSSTFYLTRKRTCSSLLPPTGRMARFYAGDSGKFDVEECLTLETQTIAEAMAGIGERLDFLKLDTQGTELSILRGLGGYKPLFIKVEMSVMEVYEGQALLWQVGEDLYKRGYMPFNLYLDFMAPTPRSSWRPRDWGSQRGLPAFGDLFVMPDWTRPEGRALFEGRDLELASLLLIFGMANIARYIWNDVETPNREKILSII